MESVHRRLTLVLLTLSFLSGLSLGQQPTSTPGDYFPSDGAVNSASLLPQWEITYFASDFLPVCGASTEAEGDQYWSNSPECEPAMAAFNSSTSSLLQKQMYNTAGGPTEARPGKSGDSQLCMCFTLPYTPKEGRMLDICLLVGKDGEVRNRKEFLSGDVAVGIQSPQRAKGKALPQCKDIDLTPSVKSEEKKPLPNTLFTTASITKASTTTTHMPVGTGSSDSGGGGGGVESNRAPGPKLSSEAVIALAVGLPGAFVSTATIIWWCCCRGRR